MISSLRLYSVMCLPSLTGGCASTQWVLLGRAPTWAAPTPGLTERGGVWPLALPRNTKRLPHNGKRSVEDCSRERGRGAVVAGLRRRRL